jgi:hypothetical protein
MSADTTKTFPTLELKLFKNANSFVKCWSRLYNYPNYELYKSLITKPVLSEGDLRSLFEWKNGMNLSTKKENSFLTQVLHHNELVYTLKKEFDTDKFQITFGKMSAIWQIFLLHILQPSTCPIFDQHVYRAFRFIQYQDDKVLPFTRSAKLNVFQKEYYPFFLDMKDLVNEYDHFEIDKALWAFGKLIKEYPELAKVET